MLRILRCSVRCELRGNPTQADGNLWDGSKWALWLAARRESGFTEKEKVGMEELLSHAIPASCLKVAPVPYLYLLRSLYGPSANTGKCPEHLATSQLSFGASLPTGLSRLPTPGLFLCLNICLHLPLWNLAALAVMLSSVHTGKTMKSFLPGIVRIPLSESDDLWS